MVPCSCQSRAMQSTPPSLAWTGATGRLTPATWSLLESDALMAPILMVVAQASLCSGSRRDAPLGASLATVRDSESRIGTIAAAPAKNHSNQHWPNNIGLQTE